MIPQEVTETMRKYANNFTMFDDDREHTNTSAWRYVHTYVENGLLTEDQETEALMVYEQEKERRLLEGYE